MGNVKLEISDLLGFCDLNGEEALESWQVEKLENYIFQCNEVMNTGVPLVVDAIYDRLCEILRKANPNAEILGELWSNDVVDESEMNKDIYRYLKEEPMKSICTCKSLDCPELIQFIQRLPDGFTFDAHISVKENGHGIRLVYGSGYLEDATSRARHSAGRNITKQITNVVEPADLVNIEDLVEVDIAEIRGEVVLPFANLEKAREFNPEIVSAFTGVSSMLRDSATKEENQLLEFVAYRFIAEGFEFETKEDEYAYLESLGFKTPLSWVIPDLTKESLLEALPEIVSECEDAVRPNDDGSDGYEFYTDGLVFEVNNRRQFSSLGGDGKYNYGNIALKVGYWKQDMYSGYIQTIMWRKGKSKLSPVAIVADDVDVAEYVDGGSHAYISDIKEISNYKELGVSTAVGNRVKRVPLFEPNNMLILNAYVGEVLYFRYGGEAGVVPCFPDGTPLRDGKLRQMLSGDEDYGDYDFSSDVEYVDEE